jgi:hypothetical protein
MTTVNSSYRLSVGGLNFSKSSTITGTNVSVIDGTYTVPTGDVDIPIYAESDSASDIKLVIFESDKELDKIQLLDAGNDVVVDIKLAATGTAAGVSPNFAANDIVSLPGTALLVAPSGTGLDDVQKLRVSGTSSASTAIKCVIVFDTTTSTAITGDVD